MMTLESGEKIKVGMELRFAELWDGNGDGQELLESGSIGIGEDENDMPVVVGFKIVEQDENILNAIVRVVDIY